LKSITKKNKGKEKKKIVLFKPNEEKQGKQLKLFLLFFSFVHKKKKKANKKM
jgi:hypothetical protein